ncbi:MAG: hypothetical protein PHE53_09100 [Thermoguttaceae bacterium]|nr:hypothetical protein [Thermoguttaceae bacterium]
MALVNLGGVGKLHSSGVRVENVLKEWWNTQEERSTGVSVQKGADVTMIIRVATVVRANFGRNEYRKVSLES